MNFVSDPSEPAVASIDAGAGRRLDAGADGRLTWAADGRSARAGDGLAAAVADVLATGDASALHASDGALTVLVGMGSSRFSTAVAEERERSLDVDQTNLSVVVDDAVVVKLVGAWGSADRAARALDLLDGSGIAPGFLGALRWTLPGRGETTVAIAAELLPGTVDGWTWAADDVAAFLDAGMGTEPAWPATVGTLIARLHDRLSAGTAVTIDVGGEDAAAAARAALDRALEAVGDSDTGLRLAARSADLDAALAEASEDLRLPAFLGHGDLHVGQLLRRPDADAGDPASYRVIDFDGDPQATDAERTSPASVLTDLAHFSTSIDMVASVVQRRLGGPDARATGWASRARSAFLAAYCGELTRLERTDLMGSRFADDSAFSRLLRLAEIEYLAREMVYATRYLPRWLYAADGAVTARFAAAPDLEDPPWTPPASPTTSA